MCNYVNLSWGHPPTGTTTTTPFRFVDAVWLYMLMFGFRVGSGQTPSPAPHRTTPPNWTSLHREIIHCKLPCQHQNYPNSQRLELSHRGRQTHTERNPCCLWPGDICRPCQQVHEESRKNVPTRALVPHPWNENPVTSLSAAFFAVSLLENCIHGKATLCAV
jgi:hypothetical protein